MTLSLAVTKPAVLMNRPATCFP
eukprot:SAG31_NODE_6541_length_1982_cov_1.657461_1_plen_22_part_10